jgi:hypothetical protein
MAGNEGIVTGKSTSLTEYAKGHKRATKGAWFDTLPADVQKQCIEGWRAGLRATTITEWLWAEGYEEATMSRVAVVGLRAK